MPDIIDTDDTMVEDCNKWLASHPPSRAHPLTIPGELLAEACRLGEPLLELCGDGIWFARLSGFIDCDGEGATPAAALQAAIAKARESVK